MKWCVRASKKGWLYNGQRYPYALDTYGFEVYFDTKEEAKKHIDKFVGGFERGLVIRNWHEFTARESNDQFTQS